MDRITQMATAASRRLTALLPADRRDWPEAVLAEAAEIPAGWQRLNWLAGGMWLTVREAARVRRPGYLVAFAAAAAGIAWSAWSGPPGDPAIAVNRIDVIAIVVILAGLAWIVRRTRGPVAVARLPRLVRAGGYTAVLALVLAKSAVERVANAPPNSSAGGPAVAWTGEAVFLAVMAGYAALILLCTARRSPALPATMVIGTAAGVVLGVVAFLLGPLGFPLRFTGPWPAGLYDAAFGLGLLLALCVPVAAGLAAARRAGRSLSAGSRARQGAMAGLASGTAAALVVAVLSTATIALLPYDVGLQQWAAAHIGQWTPVIGEVTPVVRPRLGYVAGNSAFAAGYLLVLLAGPLAGCAFGACGARVRRAQASPGSLPGGGGGAVTSFLSASPRPPRPRLRLAVRQPPPAPDPAACAARSWRPARRPRPRR